MFRPILLALVLSLVACSSKEAQVEKHFGRAKELYSQGSYDKAGVELRNALQIEPNFAAGYYLAGLLEEKRSNSQLAFSNFAKAAELDPANLDAKAKLARYFLLSGALDRASAAAEEILAVRKDDAGAEVVRAAVAAAKGDKVAALASAEALVARDPTQSEAVALAAGLQRERGDVAKARETLLAGVAASPSDEGLRGALITLLMEASDFDGAAAQYGELLRTNPGNAGYRSGLAQLHLRAGKPELAEKTLREGAAASPSEPGPLLALASFLVGSGRAADAEKELNQRLSSAPGQHAVRLGLAGLLRQQGRMDEAVREYDKVIEADAAGPDGLGARNAKAAVLAGRGRRDEAAVLVGEVLKVNPRDNDALLLRGQLSQAKGDPTSAVADFRTVLKDQPDSIPVLAALAGAHLAAKEPKLAVEVAGIAVAKYPASPEVRLMASEVRGAAGDGAGALEEVEAGLKRDPRNARLLLAKAGLQAGAKDLTAAEKTLREAVAANPQDGMAPYRLGQLLVAQKKPDQAQVQFETALARVPGAIEPLTALVQLQLSRGKADAARDVAEKAVAARPKDLMARMLLGNVYAAQKKDVEAEAAFRKALEINSRVPGVYEELANVSLRRGDAAAALVVLDDGLKVLPGDAALLHRKAMVHVGRGDADAAIRIYESLLSTRSDDVLAMNNLATLLLDNKSDAASHQRALEIAKRLDASTNPAHIDTVGWAYYRAGQFDQAVSYLRKATQQAPSVAIFNFHLGMALHSKGDSAQARPFLETAVKSGAKFEGIEQAKKILAAG